VHLVGFILRIYHDALSNERKKSDSVTLEEVTGPQLNKLNDKFWNSKQMRGF
jgi:hypothetical protein